MRKLPHIISRGVQLQLDVIAVQEIGDPAVLDSRFPPYTLIQAPGSIHQAGVALLLSQTLLPLVRSYLRSKCGRLVGAVLQLRQGHQLLLVSAYMPSGLDHLSALSEQHETAHALYREIDLWSKDMQQVVVMGDLNETRTIFDRQPQPAAAPAASGATPISNMLRDGFMDVWRTLHPSAEHRPGFTHCISGDRRVQSRIDYLWCKGSQRADLLQVHIDSSLHHLSHHRLLWMELQLPDAAVAAVTETLAPLPRIPNLQSLSDEQEQRFAGKLQAALEEHEHALQAAFTRADTESLTWAASHLTAIVREVAWSCLPMTHGAPFKSQCILRLQRQRKALTRLLHCSTSLLRKASAECRGHAHCLTDSAQWKQQYAICMGQQLQLHWQINPYSLLDAQSWLDETAQLLRDTRSSIRAEQRCMLRHSKPTVDSHPAAAVHRMLRSDEFPSQLLSVVNEQGDLTSSAAELKTVMADHFRSVFAIPPDGVAPVDIDPTAPVPPMLLDKDSVDRVWYDGLMRDIGSQELLATTADTPLVTAPGEDEVSSGLWKLALRSCAPLCSLVCALFSACLRSSVFPTCWKSSIIVPLLKDAKKDRLMSNIRPISLQSCLGKLLNKVLAHRLGDIFARHKSILHPAQRGFINGGTITKCIDELLDAWEHGREDKQEQYTLFYDIKQAYDSVQVEVIERAMRRLRMPDAFIRLVVDSLTGLTSRVRTAYGLSEVFDVLRSLRQGDPLAPLLFVILMDALHDGLERNPFTGQQHGLKLQVSGQSVLLSSLGYADDTTVLTNTLADMQVQNEWVHYFMCFNRMRLNAGKCELVGRDAAALPVTAAALAAHNISIEGVALEPVLHDRPIRYLGVHARFDGSWEAQQSKALSKIALFTRAVSKFSLTPQQAVYMFNAFLLPALELALHYVHGAGTDQWIKQCDRFLIGSIRHAVKSPIKLSHTAVALSLHLILPSWLEASIKVSELYLRVNDPDTRWGQLGRLLLRPLASQLVCSRANSDPEGRMSRAIFLASSGIRSRRRGLKWQLTQRELPSDRVRQPHLFEQPPVAPHVVPTGVEFACSSSRAMQLTGVAASIHIAHDVWRGWGALIPPQTVHAYTDGSFVAQPPSSAWAVTVADEWLDDCHMAVTTDEKEVGKQHAFIRSAVMCGASISCTQGVYPAELQAIARTLAMFPLSFILHIHSDSQASLAAIRSYELLSNERRRLRMSAHTLLQLIHHLLQQRHKAGGAVHWHHVHAHTDGSDIDSVGNRLSDYQANLRRARPTESLPDTLRQLPLQQCEHYLSIVDTAPAGVQIIDDVRQTALRQIKQAALAHWQRMADEQQYFSSRAALDTGRMVMRHGSAKQQNAFVHLITNSLHFYWSPPTRAAVASTSVQRRTCDDCSAVGVSAILTPTHLLTCPHATLDGFRQQLLEDLLHLLSQYALTADWLRALHASPLPPSLSALLLALVPYPPSIAALPPADPERQRHLTYAMCGIFTTSQLHATARTLGFSDPVNLPSGIRLVQQLGLLCIDSVSRVCLFDPP